MRSIFHLSLLAVSFAGTAYATPLSTNPLNVARQPSIFAPFLESEHPHGTVNDSYIVMLKDDASSSLLWNHFNFLSMAHEADPLLGGDVASGLQHVYDGHIKGYSGRFSERVVHQIRSMPEVAYVERDQVVRTMEVQKGAPWGLARISHRNKLTFSTFTKYEYDPKGGEGVDVYVVDTGVNIDHVEFEGRAVWGTTIPQNDADVDGNGHGTHCAGTIASRKYGVAKAATIIAVKVLSSNGSGTMSDVVAGVVWAAQKAQDKAAAADAEYAATGKTQHKGSVANMSLGGGKSRALDDAVDKAVDTGLHFAVAAGNDNRDACNYSPAGAVKAVTVAASTLSDERAYFSNHGPCVDVFAPGLNILSTWTGSKTAANTISGTSMASPHTAGLLAYLLSLYPSEQFDPVLANDFIPGTFESQPAFVPGIYTLLYTSLPSWISYYLPRPNLIEVYFRRVLPRRPVTITPLQLKRALIALGSKGLLSDLPEKTPNLLVFNNATA